MLAFIILVVTVAVGAVQNEPIAVISDNGHPCTNDYDCHLNFVGSLEMRICEAGHCVCASFTQLMYNINMVFTCSLDLCTSHSYSCWCPNGNCSYATCSASEKKCQCNDGYVLVSDRCYKGVEKKLFEDCKLDMIQQVAYFCSIDDHTVCSDISHTIGTCVCSKDYYGDASTKKCLPKSTYLAENNLTEYRVMPGVYCLSKADCIEGLECHKQNGSMECACPLTCTYDADAEACNCGKYVAPQDGGNTVGAAVVGVLLGFLSVGFWYSRIRNLLKSYAQKTTYDETPEVAPVELPVNNFNPVYPPPVTMDDQPPPYSTLPQNTGYPWVMPHTPGVDGGGVISHSASLPPPYPTPSAPAVDNNESKLPYPISPFLSDNKLPAPN